MQDNVTQERADGCNYLIRKGSYWYRPDCAGYTGNPYEAGRYTKEKAHNETHPNGPDGPRDAMRYYHVSEVEWPPLASTAAQSEVVQKLVEALEKIAGLTLLECGSSSVLANEARKRARQALAAHRESQP